MVALCDRTGCLRRGAAWLFRLRRQRRTGRPREFLAPRWGRAHQRAHVRKSEGGRVPALRFGPSGSLCARGTFHNTRPAKRPVRSAGVYRPLVRRLLRRRDRVRHLWRRLVAVGLFTSPRQAASGPTFMGFRGTVRAATDFVDAAFGIVSLALYPASSLPYGRRGRRGQRRCVLGS